MNLPLWIATRYVQRRPRSGFLTLLTSISVLGVALGVCALLTVMSVMNGFEGEIQSRIVGTDAHVTLLGQETGGIADGKALAELLAAQPGVAGAAPFVYAKAMVFHEGLSEGVVLKGISPLDQRAVTSIGKSITPALDSIPTLTLSGEPGLVLGSELTAQLGARVGDQVLLATLQPDGNSAFGYAPRLRPFRLVGVFTSGLYTYDSSVGFMSIPAAQALFDLGESVTGVEIRLTEMFDAPAASRRLLEASGRDDLRANDWIQLNRNLFTWMKLEKAVMGVILGLIVLVAAFNIVSTLFMVVQEKRRDIGVLKTLGAPPRMVAQIFLIEGLIIGGTGVVLGLVLGGGLIAILQRYPFIQLPGDVYFLETLPVRPELGDFVLVATVALILCLLAAWYPAWRASRLDPIAAIRGPA